ncbi:hypothetical protein LH935_14915 [Gordonia polyisoprenivorans]|uniref:hypothetical protein n=1 Tax=Gordonia polyisoprenivorans TaxID=84595 RepID=UPI0022348DD3|nr:hypothetical protein LH935_14915 [Gordonia polyisoprenivorans]
MAKQSGRSGRAVMVVVVLLVVFVGGMAAGHTMAPSSDRPQLERRVSACLPIADRAALAACLDGRR